MLVGSLYDLKTKITKNTWQLSFSSPQGVLSRVNWGVWCFASLIQCSSSSPSSSSITFTTGATTSIKPQQIMFCWMDQTSHQKQVWGDFGHSFVLLQRDRGQVRSLLNQFFPTASPSSCFSCLCLPLLVTQEGQTGLRQVLLSFHDVFSCFLCWFWVLHR